MVSSVLLHTPVDTTRAFSKSIGKTLMNRLIAAFLLLASLSLTVSQRSEAQQDTTTQRTLSSGINVFLDCYTWCEMDHFRREIPFENVEYIEEYSNRNGIGFYLKEKGKLWRTCIFFANAFTKSMGAPEAAVRIFTGEFEKAGIVFDRPKEDSK